ncbi:MAG: PX domain-containing protein ypt35 [Icmadophila ericetorum]|nr:PX domain-containing protein ypt35 [Icmadophila ericetorum]
METARHHSTDDNEGAVNAATDDSATVASPSALPPESISPPYWQHKHTQSYSSVISNGGRPPPITLEDHTEEQEGICSPLWAKVVSIDNHTIVSGTVKGVGDYVVWICKVTTLDGGTLTIRKRSVSLQVKIANSHSFIVYDTDTPNFKLYVSN